MRGLISDRFLRRIAGYRKSKSRQPSSLEEDREYEKDEDRINGSDLREEENILEQQKKNAQEEKPSV
jgi:hypothetical protein